MQRSVWKQLQIRPPPTGGSRYCHGRDKIQVPAADHRSTVLSIQYNTRPIYATGRLGTAFNRPAELHWPGMKAVMRYLARTINHCVPFNPGLAPPPTLVALQIYCDASFAGECNDRDSTMDFSCAMTAVRSCGELEGKNSRLFQPRRANI